MQNSKKEGRIARSLNPSFSTDLIVNLLECHISGISGRFRYRLTVDSFKKSPEGISIRASSNLFYFEGELWSEKSCLQFLYYIAPVQDR